jgi:hypothetical protein
MQRKGSGGGIPNVNLIVLGTDLWYKRYAAPLGSSSGYGGADRTVWRQVRVGGADDMRMSRHMVRGSRPLEDSHPIVDGLCPQVEPSVCCFLKTDQSTDPIIARDTESIRRKRLRNMVMFVPKNVGFGPQPEHL